MEERAQTAGLVDDATLARLTDPPPADAGALRPVLVGGCPRSGTTLVGAMLGYGPGHLTVPEAQFKSTLLEGVGDDGTVDLAWALDRLRRDWRFGLWELGLGQAPQPSPRVPYARLLDALVRAYGAANGKPDPSVWIDHTPANVRHALRLSKVLPGARFLNVVRDGRAVAASVLPLDWGPNNVFEAARWWATEIAMGLAAAQRLGGDALVTVRYEDVVDRGSGALAGVCGPLGIPFRDEMLTQRDYKVQAYTARQHRFVGREPEQKRIEAWRTELGAREVETFEYLTGDLLAFLGYGLEYRGRARAPRKTDHVADATVAIVRRQVVDKARRLARRRELASGRAGWTRRARP